MLSLDEAIAHCLEVAEEQEDFDKFQCGYCKLGCEGGVWKHTCRLPSNIPEGCSWGECSESNCPLFSNCLECAKEHRQLAEWLRELKRDRKILNGLSIYFQSLAIDAVINQRPLMFDMRDATEEERESVKRYIIDFTSTTGVDFGSIIGEVNADE